MKILTKISIKNVTGGIVGNKDRMKQLLDDKPVVLMDVFGIATSFVVQEGKEGFEPSVKLKGQFKAVNLETGEIFRSGVCFLPKMAAELVAGILKGEGAIGDVQFGFRVSARYDATSATQYVYDVESLMDVAESDPIELLEKSLKALPSSVEHPDIQSQITPESSVANEAVKPTNEVRTPRKEKVKA